MNIIGDVAGEFDTLMALVKKMPDEEFMFVGDLNDRGPNSKGVIDWVMKNANSTFGNHEHLMLDHIQGGCFYEKDLWWMYNGGLRTLQSYLPDDTSPVDIFVKRACRAVPEEHLQWMRSRPLYYQSEGLFISHAAKDNRRTLEECCDLGKGFNYFHDSVSEKSLMWNRGIPTKIKGVMQVFGHMSYKEVLYYSHTKPYGRNEYRDEDEPFAVGVDTARGKKLSGINWPTMKIYSQEFI